MSCYHIVYYSLHKIELFNSIYNNYLVNVCEILYNSVFCPCHPTATQLRSMPPFVVEFDGVTVSIPYQNYLIDVYNAEEDQLCQLCINPAPANELTFFLFGDPALMSMVAIFDKDNNQIGIYTPAGSYIIYATLMIELIILSF